MIERLKALLKGGTVIGTGTGEIEIERSLAHGHVAAPNEHASARNFRPRPNARSPGSKPRFAAKARA
ncbi:MAG: hypothetical protein ACT4O2_06800 [Beijerinckiaceae bacterium]